ncbi:uncharacterized protein BDZ99DRAFT_457833 [Mytilinidion resinicola]|uniref:Zn(II)2Cys6 transcription factor n=1 Tax=Mytilinidion resinicola TaxID=574789 RepID=A0A6A6Z6G6_9PEZI|nr:uncharacterized protein BDZ99DRAFT_457833 [Mytilinidion resinicola]KAF2815884.1 hypothetical protein BDZ99DRAFT_457833 [Mytilinidion resinicola]
MLSPTTSVEPLYASSTTWSNNNLDFILNHPQRSSPPIDPNLPTSFPPNDNGFRGRATSGNLVPPTVQFDDYGEDDHEIAFLLRHFSEGPGYWMDLFDLDTYFASYVPVKAVDNPLLKYAAVAYAAKALGRRGGVKPAMGGNFSRQARMELYPDIQSVDWYHKATQYYDRAVCHLRQALQEESPTPLDCSDMEPSWASNMDYREDNNPHSHKRRRTSSYISRQVSNPDELLAATAILSVYEFLDASVPEWSRHLNGAKSLMDIAKERMMPLQLPSPGGHLLSPHVARLNKARKATFWNIARQDMLAAFINASHTRLDTEDLPLWKEAGLLIDSRGFILPSNTDPSGYAEADSSVMKEDTISNALIWLISKLVNFMAAGDDMPDHLGGPWAGVPQRTLLEYWYSLREHFRVWYEGLPITFKPCARIEPRRVPAQLRTDDDENVLPEVWFSIPMCASTMQSYHMAQIQLLINEPHESTQGRTTVFERMHSYERTLSAALVHSREIVSIALARSDESVRIHSVQPLYTAGQCLKDERERRLILRLLSDIERDTGWATQYRVKQLLVQWGWVSEEFERNVP